jgi:hypothetical protein
MNTFRLMYNKTSPAHLRGCWHIDSARKLKRMLDVWLLTDVIPNGVIFLGASTEDSGLNCRSLTAEVRVQSQASYLADK